MMGVVKGLKALAEVPAEKRTPQISAKIAELAEFMLQHHLLKGAIDPEMVAKDGWMRFGFPRFWATDALEMLVILVMLGYRDARMQRRDRTWCFPNMEWTDAGSRRMIISTGGC